MWTGAVVTPTTTTRYDGDGNVIQTIDPNGAVTASSYDPLGRVVAATNPVSGTQLMTYTATRESAVQDEMGNVTSYAYNSGGEVIKVSDPVSGTVQYNYDADGRTTAITSGTDLAMTQLETYGYDGLGHVVSDNVGGPNTITQTTLTAYDLDGNPTEVEHPNTHLTCNSYDYADQLTETDNGPTHSPLCSTLDMAYTYDAAGNQTSAYDGDQREHVSTFDAQPHRSGPRPHEWSAGNTDDHHYEWVRPRRQCDYPDGAGTAAHAADAHPTSTATTPTIGARRRSATGRRPPTPMTRRGSSARRPCCPPAPCRSRLRSMPPAAPTSISETTYTSTFGYNRDNQPTTITVPGGCRRWPRLMPIHG